MKECGHHTRVAVSCMGKVMRFSPSPLQPLSPQHQRELLLAAWAWSEGGGEWGLKVWSTPGQTHRKDLNPRALAAGRGLKQAGQHGQRGGVTSQGSRGAHRCWGSGRGRRQPR